MLAHQLSAAIGAAPLRALNDLSRDVWRALSGGLLTDDDAQRLAETIHERRMSLRSGPQHPSRASGSASEPRSRSWSYFPPKRPQRSPDRRKSLERRRALAASGPLPPKLASRFTVGELAVLRIVADEVRAKGACVLTIPEIAARAGVGQTKVRMALREAEKLGLLTIEERRVPYRPNLPNVVRIISRDWLAWIEKTTPKRSQGGGFTFVKATESKGFLCSKPPRLGWGSRLRRAAEGQGPPRVAPGRDS
jgi:hypothetical protein